MCLARRNQGETYFCSRSGDLRYCESSEGLRSLVSPILVARRIPAGGRRSGLTPVGIGKLKSRIIYYSPKNYCAHAKLGGHRERGILQKVKNVFK